MSPIGSASGSAASILVVDDDESIIALHRHILKERGYQVQAAMSLADAVVQIQSQGADLIVSDYRLSDDATGLDLHARLKALGYNVPVILVTAFSDEQTAIAALRQGVRDLVPKTTGYIHYLPVAVERVLREVLTQRKLAESESRFQLFMDLSPAIAFVKDEDGRYLYANRGFEEACGTRQWYGKSDDQLWPEETAQQLREHDRQVLAADAPIQTTDSKLHSPTGRRDWLTLRFLLRERGDRRLLAGMAVDMTQQRLAEEALHERDEQLRQAQKMESLGTLAGGMAHEFNNLLQVILGYTRIIMEDFPDTTPIHQQLDVVVEAAERAAMLTRQLLGFSRRQTIQLTKINTNQLVQDLVKLMRPLLGEHITVQLQLDPEAGTLHADPCHIQQMLMNICVNARDAMPKGGQISISTSNVTVDQQPYLPCPELRPGRYIALAIGDTGTGMTPEVRNRIFEPFFTTKEVGKGTGLGLAMVYGLVQQHGGGIRLETAVDVGTCFTIYLPAVDEPVSASQKHVTQTGPPGAGTILVVEDEDLVREFTLRVLKNAGYDTLVARDGQEAIEVFGREANRIDLVLMDAVMPRICGRDACRRIKELRPDVPVVFCTGYDREGPQQDLMPDQGLRMIAKPFSTPTLLEEVRSAITESRQVVAPSSGANSPSSSGLALVN